MCCMCKKWINFQKGSWVSSWSGFGPTAYTYKYVQSTNKNKLLIFQDKQRHAQCNEFKSRVLVRLHINYVIFLLTFGLGEQYLFKSRWENYTLSIAGLIIRFSAGWLQLQYYCR
jgi:hypothetical protein